MQNKIRHCDRLFKTIIAANIAEYIISAIICNNSLRNILIRIFILNLNLQSKKSFGASLSRAKSSKVTAPSFQ